MYILEVNRGLGMGGAETLLALRLRHRSTSHPIGEVRDVLNVAPSHDVYARAIGEVVRSLFTTDDDSIAKGIFRTWRIAKSLPPGSIVVVHSPAASWGFKLAKFTRRRSFTLVDVAHISKYRWPYTLIGRVLNKQADLCIAVSSEVSQAATTSGYRRKVTVIGGVDRDAMRHWVIQHHEAFEQMRAEVGATRASRLIVNVANLSARKNQQLLIRAAADPALADVKIAILGEGPERGRLEQLIMELGLREKVHLLGSRPNAWQWIAIADIVVHPSIHEGLPVVLMEAAVLGVPLVATPFAGAADVNRKAADLTLIDAKEPQELAAAVARALEHALPAEEAWPYRGSRPNFFEIERFTLDFYNEVYGAVDAP